MKICFAASSGGHFEQLMMLATLMEKYDSFVLTEKTQYQNAHEDKRIYYLPQINRKEPLFPFKFVWVALRTFAIFLHEKPDLVICTGALGMLPACCFVKLFGKKLIYIESFAKITTPTRSGQYLRRYADRVYVQWESMKTFYPEALCLGGIY